MRESTKRINRPTGTLRLRLRLPVRASLWYTASSIIARAASMLATPIFTRLLSTEEYGLFPLYSSWLSLFCVVLTLEITGGVTQRALQRETDRSELLSCALGLVMTCCATGSLMYILLRRWINGLTGLGTSTTLLLLLNVSLSAIISLHTSLCRYEYRYRSIAALSIVTAIASPLIALLLIKTTPLRSSARIVASVIVCAAAALPHLYSIIYASRRIFSARVWCNLLKAALPLLPHYLAAAVIPRVGELALSSILGRATVAKYSVATSLGMALTMLTGGILGALVPWIMRRLQCNEHSGVRSIVSLCTELICIGALGILALMPEAMSILAPKEYFSALPAVFPLAISAVPILLYGVVSAAALFYERPYVSSVSSLSGASIALCTGTVIGYINNNLFANNGDLNHAAYKTGISLILKVTGSDSVEAVACFVAAAMTLAAYLIQLAIGSLLLKRTTGAKVICITRTVLILTLTTVYASAILLLRANLLARITMLIPLITAAIVILRRLMPLIKEPPDFMNDEPTTGERTQI